MGPRSPREIVAHADFLENNFLSTDLRVPVTLLDSKDRDELVNRLQTTHRGQTVFIAGHSNSVPAILSILSNERFTEIPDNEYDNLFIVTIYRFGKAKVTKLKYGNKSP